MGRERIALANRDETILFGSQFASRLAPNSVLALRGDLGAGKTTFVQGLLNGFQIQDIAQSPTFTYLQIYNNSLYHFDLYRLKSALDFHHLGFDEFLHTGRLCIIEWPDRIASLLPPETLLIDLSYSSDGRIAEITTWGER